MTDINKAIRAELERLYLTGHDIGDAGYPEPHKTDNSYIDASLAKIKALVVEELKHANPQVCKDYHSKSLSNCCDSPLTHKGLVDGKINPKLFDEVMAIAKKSDKKSGKASARLTYRFYCYKCNKQCEYYFKHV